MNIPGKNIRNLLIPVSWIYGAATGVRNFMFDRGIIKSQEFPIPIICVGNLTVGGTGKTPHVEYILGIIGNKTETAVVSRGYRRKTKGMIIATPQSSADEIGDEPFQIKTRFSEVRLVADANRIEAIEYLLQKEIKPAVNTIVLDDAFQHRYVKAGMNIMLSDYSRPVYDDRLLPAGLLRESFSQRRRANVVIVTKCPANLSVEERKSISKKLSLLPHQQLFFSTMVYGTPYNIFTQEEKPMRELAVNKRRIVAMAGIANPAPFFNEIEKYGCPVVRKPFPDHHNFSKEDLEGFKAFVSSPDTAIITTEKDAARLQSFKKLWNEEQKARIYALPIKVEFLFGEKDKFNKIISNYVGQNK